jgi:hypothetical protein
MSIAMVSLSLTQKTKDDWCKILSYHPDAGIRKMSSGLLYVHHLPKDGDMYPTLWYLDQGSELRENIPFVVLVDESTEISPPHTAKLEQHTGPVSHVLLELTKLMKPRSFANYNMSDGNFLVDMRLCNTLPFTKTYFCEVGGG